MGKATAGQTAERVVVGMDPHKRSVTIEVMAGDETVLGGGRFAPRPRATGRCGSMPRGGRIGSGIGGQTTGGGRTGSAGRRRG
jgi:hypothetical protein